MLHWPSTRRSSRAINTMSVRQRSEQSTRCTLHWPSTGRSSRAINMISVLWTILQLYSLSKCLARPNATGAESNPLTFPLNPDPPTDQIRGRSRFLQPPLLWTHLLYLEAPYRSTQPSGLSPLRHRRLDNHWQKQRVAVIYSRRHLTPVRITTDQGSLEGVDTRLDSLSSYLLLATLGRHGAVTASFSGRDLNGLKSPNRIQENIVYANIIIYCK